jgi:tRNA A37 N6-isopentenylltransferase MiaA
MNGWVLGYIIGGAVVVLVVVLLLLMIAGARRTAQAAEEIEHHLLEARDRTAALWEVHTTVATAERIVDAATQARIALSGGDRR